MLFDPQKSNGSFYNAIVNYRRRRTQSANEDLNNNIIELTEDDKNEIKHFFKTFVLPKHKGLLKSKLLETRDFRKQMIRSEFAEYKSYWSFYFVNPELVSSGDSIST